MILAKNSDDEYWLYFLDPRGVRERKLEAFDANKTRGGIEVLMEESETDQPAGKLQIQLVPSGEQDHRATLRIGFGPHALSVPVAMRVQGG